MEIDFEALGYSPDEYFERSRLAVAWASLTTLGYMVIVIGGKLLVTIYRLDGGDSSMPAAATAPVEASSRPANDKTLAGRCAILAGLARRTSNSSATPKLENQD